MTFACTDCSRCGKCYDKHSTCPQCAGPINLLEDACPNCGEPITDAMLPSRNILRRSESSIRRSLNLPSRRRSAESSKNGRSLYILGNKGNSS